MPKMKTHRGMAKRIKVTGTGRLKRGTYVKKAVKLKRRRGRPVSYTHLRAHDTGRKRGRRRGE